MTSNPRIHFQNYDEDLEDEASDIADECTLVDNDIDNVPPEDRGYNILDLDGSTFSVDTMRDDWYDEEKGQYSATLGKCRSGETCRHIKEVRASSATLAHIRSLIGIYLTKYYIYIIIISNIK